MADANVLITGDEKQFVQSLARAEEAERKLESQMEATGKAGKDAGEETGRAMEKAGKRGLSEFDKLLRELRKTGPEGRKQAAEIEKHLQETGKQGRRSMGSIVDEIEKIDPAVAEVARNAKTKFKEVGEEVKETVGERAVGSLAKFAAGWVSISAAIGLAREALARVREEQAKALESLDQQSDPNRRLLQVATSAEDFKSLTTRADDLAMQYGISREEARNLMFSGRSEGFEDSVGFIASNAQVLDVASQATVAGQIPGLFQGEGLRAEEAINMGLVAAAESRLNFEEIARAMPGAAEGGALAGAGSAETFGALSVLAGRFKSGDTAADRLKAFTSAVGLDQGNAEMGRESLQGAGIVDAVQRLQAMTEEQRRDFLGEGQEVNAAYTILVEEFDKIQNRISTIEEARTASGTERSAIAMRREIAQSDPQLRALQQQRAAENRREIANERANAEKEALRQAQQDTTVAGAKNRGQSELEIAAGEMTGDALRGIGADQMAQSAVGAIVGGDLAALQRSAAAALNERGMRDMPHLQGARNLRALNFGANMLSQQDQMAQPGTLGQLSRDQTATFLSEMTGQQVELQRITPELQAEVTRQIRAAAAANPQRSDSDFTGIAASVFGGGVRADLQAIMPEVKIDKLIQLMEQTANNTSPANRPPNYSAGLSAGAAGAAQP